MGTLKVRLFTSLVAALLVLPSGYTKAAPTDSVITARSPIVYAVELGFGMREQKGIFLAPCGCEVYNARGGMFTGGVYAETPVGGMFRAGMRASVSSSKSTNIEYDYDADIVRRPDNTLDTIGSLQEHRTSTFSLTEATISPFLELRPFSGLPFLRLGPAFAYVVSTNVKISYQLVSSDVVLSNGSTLHGVTFPNGTDTHTVEDEPIPGAKTWIVSGQAGIGWDFALFGLNLSPSINIDIPVTTLTDTRATNLRMNSYYGALAVEF